MKLAFLPGSILQKENYMMQHILDRIASVTPLDTAAMVLARARQQQLTKPVGSLGRLEDIAIQMAGISKQPLPSVKQKAVIIMAGDHGVTREGVSAYPSAVTPQMVYNFLRGGAAINALAHQIGAKVIVVDTPKFCGVPVLSVTVGTVPSGAFASPAKVKVLSPVTLGTVF